MPMRVWGFRLGIDRRNAAIGRPARNARCGTGYSARVRRYATSSWRSREETSALAGISVGNTEGSLALDRLGRTFRLTPRRTAAPRAGKPVPRSVTYAEASAASYARRASGPKQTKVTCSIEGLFLRNAETS